ncbi:tripartite tricarboxylate transporter TctB family protein [Rhodovulum steppense]|uniref:Tripartite tricarboxylate transporter TctB family protein n=1 Tax=Rhodovulum steppense TaxID=540251 RepID=A0A4V2R4P3_9RHOB|nr:tripartite tricarboxylate transporter TctB family protein [Rhodovulum steppense]TCM84984.1 tripartite tricarboxylate transporter TctB family protein [Rhodovulum steppense]
MPPVSEAAERRQELIAGGLLLVLALAWTAAVWLTVPVGQGVGPRAFPFWLGVALAVLSALLLLKGLRGGHGLDPPGEGEGSAAAPPVSAGRRLALVATVCGIIAAYGLLMQKIGFLPATVLTVSATLVVALGERRPLVVGGMAIGIALGAWLAFGKLLGAYMPRGTWISLF